MKKLFVLASIILAFCGCANYPYANNMKLVGFDDNPKKGKSVGNIRGEDCTWNILGFQMGGLPTVDRAFIDAKNQVGPWNHNEPIRYVNNVTTSNGGFNAGLFAKTCIVMTGVGYK